MIHRPAARLCGTTSPPFGRGWEGHPAPPEECTPRNFEKVSLTWLAEDTRRCDTPRNVPASAWERCSSRTKSPQRVTEPPSDRGRMGDRGSYHDGMGSQVHRTARLVRGVDASL